MSGEGTARGGRIIPALRYRNAAAAIDWLCDAFGFELTLGNGMIMLGDVKTEYGRLVAAPVKGDPVTQGIYVVVEDADAHYTRAKAAGAEIVLDIKTQDYGGRDYTARDLEAMSGPSALTILGRAERRRPA